MVLCMCSICYVCPLTQYDHLYNTEVGTPVGVCSIYVCPLTQYDHLYNTDVRTPGRLQLAR